MRVGDMLAIPKRNIERGRARIHRVAHASQFRFLPLPIANRQPADRRRAGRRAQMGRSRNARMRVASLTARAWKTSGSDQRWSCRRPSTATRPVSCACAKTWEGSSAPANSTGTTLDGTPVALRPIRPGDEPVLQDLFAHMSREDARALFAPMHELSHALAAACRIWTMAARWRSWPSTPA